MEVSLLNDLSATNSFLYGTSLDTFQLISEQGSKWLKWWKLLQRLGEEDSLPLLIGSGDAQTDNNKKKSEGSMVWMALVSIAGKTDEKLMSVEEGIES
ncbi:hypothetical protein GBA52_028774 [Prunus armeniaca]|nr:hypothetical protein GBA52_029098 [Prunus armeniaca]KAH0969404.1 hypothetical protein GBA52_028774 [Prunus armeniaca]